MIVGIDASNIRGGGGLTHLCQMLAAASPEDFGVERVVIWANAQVSAALPARDWLDRQHVAELDRRLPSRLLWQHRALPRLAADQCDVLFLPGGNGRRTETPTVAMSQNMLPFEWKELSRYGPSWTGLRLAMLRFGQGRTFCASDGMIFLTEYARDSISAQLPIPKRSAVVPHGVEDRFRMEARSPRPLEDCDESRPLRLLYVSIIDLYKHQWVVAEAVARLRARGLPLRLDLVGPAFPRALRRLRRTLDRLDPEQRFLYYSGPVRFEDLHRMYENAEIFVFASSCENMPNILCEGMAASLPIACAQRGPMPEILGDAGVYFDPEDADSTATALETLARDPELRSRLARQAAEQAAAYSWERCGRETFEFISSVAAGPR